MAKYGKRNIIKIDPARYNIGLLGESGIGKTTLMVRVLEKLVGEDGYMILNVGMEDGIDAINGAAYEDIVDFDVFEEFVDDIIENRFTDYETLRVLVFDTMDELFRIAEPEVIRLHNRAYPDKPVKSIKAAFGGYQAGEEKAIEIVLDKVKKLKDVGISVWWTGHVKRRTLTDPQTQIEYDMLTTNIAQKYFNAVKTKLHVLGVASIDREIAVSKSKKKGFDGKDKLVGQVTSEVRKITFRDDNFSIDSKSRFADIVDEIEFSVDGFIQAINDAIRSEFESSPTTSKSIKDVKAEQESEFIDKAKDKVVEYTEESEAEELSNTIKKISGYIKKNKTDKEKIKVIIEKYNSLGYDKISSIDNLEDALAVLEVCN
jgi:hypothetical protein